MIQEVQTSIPTLSGRILNVLLKRDLTQSKIAAIIGANRSHISRVKSGEHEFSDTQLDKIENFTGIPLGLLLLGTDPPPGASVQVRRLHKEAYELLRRSDAGPKALPRRSR